MSAQPGKRRDAFAEAVLDCVAAMLQPGVVRDGHPGQLRWFLAPQARDPPVTAVLRQPDILGLEAGAAGTQEFAETGAPVKVVPRVTLTRGLARLVLH